LGAEGVVGKGSLQELRETKSVSFTGVVAKRGDICIP